MRNYDDFDTVPTNEPCESLGEGYDETKARNEARRLIMLLQTKFGIPPEGSWFALKRNPHDFGSYITVRYCYDDDDPNHAVYFDALDNNFPDTWEGNPAIILEYTNGEKQEYPDTPELLGLDANPSPFTRPDARIDYNLPGPTDHRGDYI